MLTVCFALQGESCRGSGLAHGAIMARAIRRHMPAARLVQLSNLIYPALPGVDLVLRRENTGDFIRWAFRSMLDLFDCTDGPILQLATDIVVRRDVSEVFEQSFDVAACRYPLMDRTDGAYCGDTNFIQPSGRHVWKEALGHYERTPAIQNGWEGGQTAMLWALQQPGVTVLDLDFHTYNFTPERPGQIPETAAIVHYRGLRKTFMMHDQIQEVAYAV